MNKDWIFIPMKSFALFVILFFITMLHSAFLQGQSFNATGVVKQGAALQLISDQFAFTEGPAVDKNGDIYFTDQPNDKIWIYDTSGKLSVFMNKTGRSNGMYFDNNGKLIACADENNQLLAIGMNGKTDVLLNGFDGHKFNGPNDLWIDKKGGIYFTDPYYQRDYWERKKPDLEGQFVYYLPEGEHKAFVADSLLVQPNGIVGTPDGKFLFVADIGDSKTYKYEINNDGTLSKRQLFVSQGSDGMTIDNEGNLYISGKGITVFDKTGMKTEHIAVPEDWVGNLCFGGKERDVLFITASKSVYTLQMRVKGVK